MLVREGEIGHRIEIQIFFEYIYICPRYILSYEKRKIVIKTGEKIRDGRERRIVSAILDHDSRSVSQFAESPFSRNVANWFLDPIITIIHFIWDYKY